MCLSAGERLIVGRLRWLPLVLAFLLALQCVAMLLSQPPPSLQVELVGLVRLEFVLHGRIGRFYLSMNGNASKQRTLQSCGEWPEDRSEKLECKCTCNERLDSLGTEMRIHWTSDGSIEWQTSKDPFAMGSCASKLVMISTTTYR